MSSFHLQIVTPDGLFYDGQAESLNLRAAQGGLTILPRHTNFVTTVGMGPAKVVLEGKSRIAACIGGMLSVINGEVRLIATTFEWAEDIDRERAKSALARAEEKLGLARYEFARPPLLTDAEIEKIRQVESVIDVERTAG